VLSNFPHNFSVTTFIQNLITHIQRELRTRAG
jgi:hypothetical protein